MKMSLSPSVCDAFLGRLIEKAVDELNLTKKIILRNPDDFTPSGSCRLLCSLESVCRAHGTLGSLAWRSLDFCFLYSNASKRFPFLPFSGAPDRRNAKKHTGYQRSATESPHASPRAASLSRPTAGRDSTQLLDGFGLHVSPAHFGSQGFGQVESQDVA